MVDVIALLRREHRTLQILFEEYMTSEDRPTLAAAACNELLIHMAGEEEVLYPAVERELRGGQLLVREALEEHRYLTEVIAELDGLGYDHPDSDELMHDIIAVATTHIDEAERGLLFDVKVVLTLDELAELGNELVNARAVRQAYLRMQFTERAPAESEIVEPEPAESADPVDAVALTDLTRRQLYELAAEQGISGRSRMSRDELIDALTAR